MSHSFSLAINSHDFTLSYRSKNAKSGELYERGLDSVTSVLLVSTESVCFSDLLWPQDTATSVIMAMIAILI